MFIEPDRYLLSRLRNHELATKFKEAGRKAKLENDKKKADSTELEDRDKKDAMIDLTIEVWNIKKDLGSWCESCSSEV